MQDAKTTGMGSKTFRVAALLAASLIAVALGARANAQEVLIPDPLTRIAEDADLENVEGRDRLVLVGPRNGYASAQVVWRGEWPVGTKVVSSPLQGETDVIDTEHIRVRFAHKLEQRFPVQTGGAGDPHRTAEVFTNHPYFDVLHEAPQPDTTLVPIWMTVHIPADVAPGSYEGTLTVGEQKVPVHLEAGAWVCPEPRDFVMHVGLKHSPDTLARTYNVPMWSDEHFALIKQSFAYMAALGNKDMFITCINQTHLGNEQSIVRFRRKGETLEPDFSIMDRYLDTYKAVGGRPRYLIFYLWHPAADREQQRRGGLPVTVVNEDGSVGVERLPAPGYPGSAEAWRPMLDGIRDRIVARGWDTDMAMIGVAGDKRPKRNTVDFFTENAPYARWSVWSHFRGDPAPRDGKLNLGGMEIGHYHHPFCPSNPFDIERGLVGGWNVASITFTMPRKYLYQYSPLSQYRNFAEGVLIGGGSGRGHSARGFARLLLDFWEVDKARSLYLRYHTGDWDNMYRDSPRYIVAPGPKGPLSTTRYEMLREGIQEAEARIVIERAILEGNLQEELAERCTQLLRERYSARMRDGAFSPSHARQENPFVSRIWGVAPNWQELSAQLFELAAAVQDIQARP